jgi:hypothetical protein
MRSLLGTLVTLAAASISTGFQVQAAETSGSSSLEPAQSIYQPSATVISPTKTNHAAEATRSIADASGTQTAAASGSAAKSSLPKKALSLASALVIGTPVCIVRRTKYEEWYAVHGFLGDTKSKFKKVLFGTVWFPFAAVCGTAEAPFDAFANGLMYPAFSKDQLSEGKLVQNN